MIKTLQYIAENYGTDVLRGGSKLIAYFWDLAPHLVKQCRLLSAFVECNGHTKFAGLACDSLHEQSVCIQQIVKEMTEDMFVAESAAETICNAFFFAVSGHGLRNAKHIVHQQMQTITIQVSWILYSRTIIQPRIKAKQAVL